MSVTAGVPEGLVRMAPGPELAAALAQTDLPGLGDVDAVAVLRASKRQQNHAQAAIFAAIVEVAGRNPDPAAPPLCRDEWGTEEVRAALVLTRVGATSEVNLAEGVVLRLPELHAAMYTGRVDRTRAWLLWSMTQHMSEAHARAVCEKLLPKCHTWTPGQLSAKIAKQAIALDPGWEEARQKAASKQRRVVGSMNDDGTADLCGYSLPAERVIAAMGRMDELAKRAKRDGDRRGIDFLRAEMYACLLDGTFEGFTDEDILIYLARTRPTAEEAEAAKTQESAERAARAVQSAAAEGQARAAARAARAEAEDVDAAVRRADQEAAARSAAEAEAVAAAVARAEADATKDAEATGQPVDIDAEAGAYVEAGAEPDAEAEAEAAETGPPEPETAETTSTGTPRADGIPSSRWLASTTSPNHPGSAWNSKSACRPCSAWTKRPPSSPGGARSTPPTPGTCAPNSAPPNGDTPSPTARATSSPPG